MSGQVDKGALPNIIVIGAQKCGTTALHYYLALHPEISMSAPKELNFFIDEPVAETSSCALSPEELTVVSRVERNWPKGLAWYALHFSRRSRVRGEASPNYTAPWYPDAAAKMASVIPDAKLIFLVRDPIDRAVSHYLTLRAVTREQRPPEVALSDVGGMYVSRSRYHAVLQPYLEHFPESRVLVLAQEDLRDRRREAMARIYRFVGVDDGFWSEGLERERNESTARPRLEWMERWLDRLRIRQRLVARIPSGAKWRIERALLSLGGPAPRPELEPVLRRRLADYLGEDANRLRKLTGESFPNWSV